jgi:anti-sigma factor ChrR (cupin superfamily)
MARCRSGHQVEDASRDPLTGERTTLMRMEPGCVYPEHDHPQVEECFVLEGAVTIDGQDYGPGDYTIAQTGTGRGTILSAPGGLVLLHWNSAAALGAGLAP